MYIHIDFINCTNRRDDRCIYTLRFHSFPKNKELLKKWKVTMRREGFENICTGIYYCTIQIKRPGNLSTVLSRPPV